MMETKGVAQWLREKSAILTRMADEMDAMCSLDDASVSDRMANLLADKVSRRPCDFARELRIPEFMVRRIVRQEIEFVVNGRGWISLSHTGGNGDVS